MYPWAIGQQYSVNFEENSLLQIFFWSCFSFGSEITTDQKHPFNVLFTSWCCDQIYSQPLPNLQPTSQFVQILGFFRKPLLHSTCVLTEGLQINEVVLQFIMWSNRHSIASMSSLESFPRCEFEVLWSKIATKI